MLGYARIEIGWESTGTLWIRLHRWLTTEPLLDPFKGSAVCREYGSKDVAQASELTDTP